MIWRWVQRFSQYAAKEDVEKYSIKIVNTIRVNAAKRLLRDTNMAMVDIDGN